MKFPLRESPFPTPLVFATEQVARLEKLAEQQLDELLRSYQQHQQQQNSSANDGDRENVDPRKWQQIKKTPAALMVYKSTSAANASASAAMTVATASSMYATNSDGVDTAALKEALLFNGAAETSHSALPVVAPLRGALAVGTVPSRYDDVMLGMIARNDHEMALQAAQTDSEFLDGRVLAELPICNTKASDTRTDPFQYSSIKWIARATAKMPVTGKILRVHDVVVLECTGTRVLPNGEQVGYRIVQSLALRCCGPLEGVTRDTVFFGLLCKPNQRGVALYGTVWASSAVSSRVLIASCTQLGQCGANKKLAWMVTESNAQRRDRCLMANYPETHERESETTTNHKLTTCARCEQRLGRFQHIAVTCEVCLEMVCGSCITPCRLSFVMRYGDECQQEVKTMKTCICGDCVERSTLLDATRVLVTPRASTKSPQ